MAPSDVIKDAMTLPEFCTFIGCSYKTLMKWRGKGKTPRSFRYLGRVYIKRADAEAFRRSLIQAA